MKRWLRCVALAGTLVLAASAAVPSAWAQQSPVYVVQRGDTLFKIARANGLTVAQLKAFNGLSSDVISVGQRLVVRPMEEAPPRPMLGAELPGLPPASDVPPRDPIEGPAEETPTAEPAPLVDEYADAPADVGPSVVVTSGGLEVVLNPPAPIPLGPPPPPPPPATISRVRIGAGTSGQVILAPSPVSAEEGVTQVHVVQPGETLFAIARRYGTTVDAIRRLNGLAGDVISVGQQLAVAGTARPVTPVAVPQGGRPYDVTRSTVGDDQVHTVVRGETLFSIAARYGTTVGRLLAVNTLTTAPLPAGTLVVLPDSAGIQHYRRPAPPPAADEAGLALVYPDSYEGRETISGEPYDPSALTASHRTLPFGTVLHVTMPATGRSTLVRVNDRGPVSEGFLVELSEAAAAAIGQNRGAAEQVELRVVR